MKDFTIEKYGLILDELKQRFRTICGVLHWHLNAPGNGALVRHDVDRKPLNALAMAKLEAEKGIFTTYYFRIVDSAYDESIIREVASLGHEVGYHYEDLALARGNEVRAHQLFAGHLEMLRKITPIKTVAMHGSPLTRFNNIDIWSSGSLHQYDITADAFLTLDYRGMPYFTDTGRSWSAGSANLRDKPPTAQAPPASVQSSDDLLTFIQRTGPERLALSAHPERWAISEKDWWLQLGKDVGVNSVKRIIHKLR